MLHITGEVSKFNVVKTDDLPETKKEEKKEDK